MVAPLQRVLVCSPRTSGWNQPQRLAAWRDLGFHHAPDFAIAQSQHDALVRELKSAGAEVLDLPSADDGPVAAPMRSVLECIGACINT